MPKATKQKIIDASKAYFNQMGFGATSLYELANAMGMSRGNLAYHFKSKEALLEAISKEMWTKIEQERLKSRQFPSFENLHNEVQLYYRFQKEYAFIFLDAHVLNHPIIQQHIREMTQKTIADNVATIAFAIKFGNMEPEPIPGMYRNIAFLTWMIAFYWLSQQRVRGGDAEFEDGEKLIWSILIPHLTPKGIQSFKNFFGEAYYKNLGEPIPLDLIAF